MCFPQEIFTARNYDIGPLLLPRRGLEGRRWARIWWSLRDGTFVPGESSGEEEGKRVPQCVVSLGAHGC